MQRFKNGYTLIEAFIVALVLIGLGFGLTFGVILLHWLFKMMW